MHQFGVDDVRRSEIADEELEDDWYEDDESYNDEYDDEPMERDYCD